MPLKETIHNLWNLQVQINNLCSMSSVSHNIASNCNTGTQKAYWGYLYFLAICSWEMVHSGQDFWKIVQMFALSTDIPTSNFISFPSSSVWQGAGALMFSGELEK